MSIVTRHGDGGETSLLYGGRVPKDDLHTEAYGALDEAISALGLARALCSEAARAQRILDLQRDLFTVGAELATAASDEDKLEKHFATVTAAMTEALDAEVARLEARVALPRGFVIPGGDPVAAALDLGRTLVRRAERRA
ncbi:MAG: ATP:cob(I)alamin adenosyltransferase, partial [Candidatus Dormibacteria bacterium]